MMDCNKILVIPDVHGREFWRKAMDFKGDIVFLGDYLDPYPSEHIDMEKAMAEFLDIMNWAKENEKVHLLLGNHDWHYIYPEFNSTRKDFMNEEKIHDMFVKNKSLFHRYWFIDSVLFTHAGIGKKWMKWMLKTDWRDAIENADHIDLYACGPERWGENPASGPLWLDYNELNPMRFPYSHRDEILLDDEVKYQIFGHTQQRKTGSIATGDGWASIDSRAVFEVCTANPAETIKTY